MQTLRENEDAPKQRNIEKWLEYVGKFELPKTEDDSVLPGENVYDLAVRKHKITYDEAVKREKAREQIIINERRQLELDQQRGKMLTHEKHKQLMEEQQAALLKALSELPNIAAQDFVKADKPAIKKKAKRWINEIRRAVAAELGE